MNCLAAPTTPRLTRHAGKKPVGAVRLVDERKDNRGDDMNITWRRKVDICAAPFLDMGHLTAHRTTKSLGCQVLGTGVIRITPLAAHLTLKEPGPPVSERSTFIIT